MYQAGAVPALPLVRETQMKGASKETGSLAETLGERTEGENLPDRRGKEGDAVHHEGRHSKDAIEEVPREGIQEA